MVGFDPTEYARLAADPQGPDYYRYPTSSKWDWNNQGMKSMYIPRNKTVGGTTQQQASTLTPESTASQGWGVINSLADLFKQVLGGTGGAGAAGAAGSQWNPGTPLELQQGPSLADLTSTLVNYPQMQYGFSNLLPGLSGASVASQGGAGEYTGPQATWTPTPTTSPSGGAGGQGWQTQALSAMQQASQPAGGMNVQTGITMPQTPSMPAWSTPSVDTGGLSGAGQQIQASAQPYAQALNDSYQNQQRQAWGQQEAGLNNAFQQAQATSGQGWASLASMLKNLINQNNLRTQLQGFNAMTTMPGMTV